MANRLQGSHQFKWSTFFITWLITTGQWCFGYPASMISTTLGERPFLEYMNLINPITGKPTPNTEGLEGATSAVFNAGAFINTFITAYVLDKYGRKRAVRYGAIIGIFGGALCAGATNIGMASYHSALFESSAEVKQFIVGRFFTGMSAISFLALTPVYSAEMAPPQYRGFFIGFNGVNIALGYALAAWTGAGTFFAKKPVVRWRVPLSIYLFFPFMMIGLLFFIPESPRWLLLKGRIEEARIITERLHLSKNPSNNDFVNAEFYQMQKQAEIDRTLDSSWRAMFGAKYRKRTLLCVFYAFIGQSTAILVINNYGPTFYRALGFSAKNQLFLTAGWVTTGMTGCIVGACGLDRLGRRPLMLAGIGGCVVCLSAFTACVAEFVGTTNTAGQSAGVAMLFLFNFIYNIGVDVGGNCFYAEAFPNHVRSKGVALANASLAIADLIYLEVTPTAFAHVGWKFFLLFLTVSAVGWVVLFMYLPETNGIPLEEMARVFGDEEDIAVRTGDFRHDMEFERVTEKPFIIGEMKEVA